MNSFKEWLIAFSCTILSGVGLLAALHVITFYPLELAALLGVIACLLVIFLVTKIFKDVLFN